MATTAELAGMLGLTARRVQQLVAGKIIPAPGKQGHDLSAAVRAYVEYLRQPAQATSLRDAKARKIELECKLKELALGERQNQLVSRDAVEKRLFDMTRVIRDALLNLPTRCAGTLAAMTSQEAIFSLLTKEVRICLEELADPPTT